MSLEQLYQQVILDHAKDKVGWGLADSFTGESFQVNPTCGDEITLRVEVAAGRIKDISWEGHGCSISQASASMMVELVKGLDLEEFQTGLDTMRALMDSRGAGIPEAEERLGDAASLTGVSKYPARIKCALLGWMAAADAVARSCRKDDHEDSTECG